MDKTVRVSGRDIKLAPFTLEQAEEILLIADKAAEKPLDTKLQVRCMVEVLVIALRRVNEDIDARWVKKNVLVPELRSLYATVMKAGGTQEAEPGKAEGP